MLPVHRILARTLTHLRTSRYGWVALYITLFMAVSTGTRLLLVALTQFNSGASAADLVRALGSGGLRDVLVAMWLASPLLLYLTLLSRSSYERRWSRIVLRAAMALSIFGALFVAVAEIVFFDEFDGRFNFVAVDYLIYPTEVVSNIWQSYPIAPILGILAGLTFALLFAMRRTMRGFDTPRTLSWKWRGITLLAYSTSLAILTFGIERSPSRVSDDRVVNELASNGYHAFWQALLGQDAPYEGLYATRPDDRVFPRLHALLAEPAAGASRFGRNSTDRLVRALGPERRLNVVVVLEESLGSSFVGALNPSDTSLTPHLDSLALEGMLLTRVYSTGNRTIRALETTTASLPPLPGISIVRRLQSEDLFTLPNLLRARGYATEFIYGGRALFDGMGRYMLRNGMERVVEQKDFPDTAFATAWGVADEYIFDRALAEMDSLHATGKPFYTLVLSVSNHKPYAFPAGRIAPRNVGRSRSNAVQYADWALGRFVRQARARQWFDSTLFVLVGDHGARVYGAAQIPLQSYEVPVVLYGPSIIPAGARVNTLSSLMDIPPTILALLGVNYSSKFFGHDVLNAEAQSGRAVMTHNSEVALLRDSTLVVLGLKKSITTYKPQGNGQWIRELVPSARAREQVEDAIAFFTGADRLYRRGDYRFSRNPSATDAALVVEHRELP